MPNTEIGTYGGANIILTPGGKFVGTTPDGRSVSSSSLAGCRKAINSHSATPLPLLLIRGSVGLRAFGRATTLMGRGAGVRATKTRLAALTWVVSPDDSPYGCTITAGAFFRYDAALLGEAESMLNRHMAEEKAMQDRHARDMGTLRDRLVPVTDAEIEVLMFPPQIAGEKGGD